MESACELATIEEAQQLDSIEADWVSVYLDKKSSNIFLSHSGAQKNFVEQLCEDLEQANQFPFFDKRTHSLPKVEKFAPLIFTATRDCELAVVMVSEQYFTRSKWPMLELAAIVQAPGCKILPLFFGLSCKEFKNPKRRERWFQVWDEWSKLDSRICVEAWKDALQNLDGLNGMEYVKANGEVAYRKEIVTTICDLIQLRSHDEVFLMKRSADSDAYEFHQHQRPGRGATRLQRFMFSCIQTTLLVYLVVAVTIVLLVLFYGYVNHYFSECKASPVSISYFRVEDSLTATVTAHYSAENQQWSQNSYNKDHVRADELPNAFLMGRSGVEEPEKITSHKYSAAAFPSLRPQIFNNFSTVDERRAYFDTIWDSDPLCLWYPR